jgi:hypothetical protein
MTVMQLEQKQVTAKLKVQVTELEEKNQLALVNEKHQLK